MIRFQRLGDFRKHPNFDDYIAFVNRVRAHYQWSTKTYTADNSSSVYLIVSKQNVYGYFDA